VTDNTAPKTTIRLPPYPYAVQLIDQFEAFIGFEYHWYRRSLFRQRFETTYRENNSSQARDRLWLCQLLGVLALGESYNSLGAPLIEVAEEGSRGGGDVGNSGPDATPLPGAGFFEQALSLYKTPLEEPSVEHVQALNLIVRSSHAGKSH
jgi:proline utilization trans-activator